MQKCYAIRIWKNIIEMVDLYLTKFLFIYELEKCVLAIWKNTWSITDMSPETIINIL